MYCTLESLVDFDFTILNSESSNKYEMEAVNLLLPLLAEKIELDSTADLEVPIMKEIMAKVISKLGRQSVIEKKHRSWLRACESDGDQVNITAASLGMGSKEPANCTWYGEPDGRVRGVSPTPEESLDMNVIGIDNPLPETDSGTSTLEFKRSIKQLSQAIGTVVIASFTEHTLHPSKNPMVPTLLINSQVMKVFLYDCVRDVLMISENVDIIDDSIPTSAVQNSFLLFLWLFINHRSA